MMWLQILGLYLGVVLGLIVLVLVQGRSSLRSLVSRRRGHARRSFWVQVWRWLRYVARCGRRRKRRAKPVDDRREERRALRKQLREEAEEWVTKWIEKIVELGDDLLETNFDDDDEDDEFFLGDDLGSGEEGSDGDGSGTGSAEPSDGRQAVYGLVNTGNSCFFNSVLQALASAEYLQNYLASTLEHMDEINDAYDANVVSMPLTEALWETLVDLNAVVGRDSAFQPFAVMAALGSSRLNDREQQDAQEAFQLISTALSEERHVFTGLQIPSLLNSDLAAMLTRIGDQKPHVFSVPRGLECVGTKGLPRVKALMKLASLAGLPTEGQSLTFGRRQVLQNPFAGLMASRLSCMKCGYTEAVRHFAFDNVSLPLPLAATCTLERTLREYISLEELEDFQCRKCRLSQTLHEFISEIKEATRWLERNPEYNIAETEAEPCTTPKDGRRVARAVLTWRRAVLNDPDQTGMSSSDSDCDLDDDSGDCLSGAATPRPEYPINPATLVANRVRRMPSPRLVNVPGVVRQLREDAGKVAASLRNDVQRPLPDIPLRKARNQVSTKQVAFAKLPPCLCLHLSRSTFTPDGYPVKNPCHVRFPEYLDFSPYTTSGNLRVSPEKSMIESSRGAAAGLKAGTYSTRRIRDALEALGPDANLQASYRLQAVVVHIGSHSYGHFITYRRKPRPPMRSGVNTPRYRSGSAASMPLHSSGTSTQGAEKRYATAALPLPTEASDSLRKRRIVGGSTSNCSYNPASTSDLGSGTGADLFSPAGQSTWPKRSWRVTDAMTAEWYLISDEDVQAVTLAEVLNANPYLLIYERIDGPQAAGYAGTPGIIPSLTNLRHLARRSASAQSPLHISNQDAESSPVSDSDEFPLTLDAKAS
ncbi:ubiquitin-specific protease ubp1 [Coemansia sp. RSA 552]|nr:ubiquitin-specific protease ubp1 [Coemansia sp. RSA 552]